MEDTKETDCHSDSNPNSDHLEEQQQQQQQQQQHSSFDSHSDSVSAEKAFHLSADYVRKTKAEQSASDWEEKGLVLLPMEGGLTKLVVELDADPILASEIKELYLYFNPVTTIVGAERLAGMKRLEGNDCGLEQVPLGIEKMPALEEVYFRHENNIGVLPPRLMEMPTLRTVSALENRNLQTVSTSKTITCINVSGCDIRSLPDDFFHYALEMVELQWNKNLQTVPSAGKNLKHLYVSGCDIRSLPDNLLHHALEEVWLEGNKGEETR